MPTALNMDTVTLGTGGSTGVVGLGVDTTPNYSRSKGVVAA
jgi:hypothetical protein